MIDYCAQQQQLNNELFIVLQQYDETNNRIISRVKNVMNIGPRQTSDEFSFSFFSRRDGVHLMQSSNVKNESRMSRTARLPFDRT